MNDSGTDHDMLTVRQCKCQALKMKVALWCIEEPCYVYKLQKNIVSYKAEEHIHCRYTTMNVVLDDLFSPG